MVPIVYGRSVDEKLIEMEKNGKMKIGAGFVGIDRPNWHCKKCGNEFLR